MRILLALALALAVASPASAAPKVATIEAARDGATVTVTWTAPSRSQYLWAAVTCPGYDSWHQVRYEGWSENPSVWADVPAGPCTAALLAPKYRGEQRVWNTLAQTPVP